MNARLILSASAILILAACETPSGPAAPVAAAPPRAAAPIAQPPPAAPVTAEFRTSDFAWSTVPGKGSVEGQVTYKAGGKTYVCSTQGVVLSPDTPWVKRRMEILYLSSEHAQLPAADVRARTPPERNADYNQFVRRATCDANGRFTFSNLADGAWYVISVIRSAPGVEAGEIASMRKVIIRNGGVARVGL